VRAGWRWGDEIPRRGVPTFFGCMLLWCSRLSCTPNLCRRFRIFSQGTTSVISKDIQNSLLCGIVKLRRCGGGVFEFTLIWHSTRGIHAWSAVRTCAQVSTTSIPSRTSTSSSGIALTVPPPAILWRRRKYRRKCQLLAVQARKFSIQIASNTPFGLGACAKAQVSVTKIRTGTLTQPQPRNRKRSKHRMNRRVSATSPILSL